MKYPIVLSLVLLLSSPKLFAQEEMQISKNAASLDIGAFYGFYSLNYERTLLEKNFAIVPKVGLYIHPTAGKQSLTYTTPDLEQRVVSKPLNSVNFGVDFIYGKSKHFAELSFNVRLMAEFYSVDRRGPQKAVNYAFEPRIGYRFQPHRKGLFGRVLIRPLFIENLAKGDNQGNKTRVFMNEFRTSRLTFIPLTFGIGYSF